MKKFLLVLLLATSVANATDIYLVPFNKMVSLKARDYMYGEMNKKELTGHNDGKHIHEYMDTCRLGYPKGYPYCAAIITWSMYRSANDLKLKTNFPRTALAYNFYVYGKKYGVLIKTTVYQENDIIVWNKINTINGHAEWIYSVLAGGNVYVMSGNTSNGKSGNEREGNGNYIRKRNLRFELNRMRLKAIVRMTGD